jgi:hypothetical protein
MRRHGSLDDCEKLNDQAFWVYMRYLATEAKLIRNVKTVELTAATT